MLSAMLVNVESIGPSSSSNSRRGQEGSERPISITKMALKKASESCIWQAVDLKQTWLK